MPGGFCPVPALNSSRNLPADEVYTMSTRPFAGLKVIEYGEYISAPYCTRLLAGLGADVIKVEKAGGDEARINGPFPKTSPTPRKAASTSPSTPTKRASL